MQTFLPFDDFHKTAKCLDMKRLGKQRVETLQILQTLSGESKGWANHPVMKMWKYHERCLVSYGLILCEEWISRGYKDTCLSKIYRYDKIFEPFSIFYPDWFHDESFHLSHQSNLLRKNEKHYSQYFPDVPLDLEYIWPVAEDIKTNFKNSYTSPGLEY